MTKSPCENYTPWIDHGLQITQCLEFWKGQCGESLSPHYKQDCPWANGYPCPVDTGEGRWKAPERALVENVAEQDRFYEED